MFQHLLNDYPMCSFAQYVKKAHKPLQLAIEDEVGDLAGIRVHKFRFSRQDYLIAYRPSEKDTPMAFLFIDFYQVGSHENFYVELKHYLRQENSKGASK